MRSIGRQHGQAAVELVSAAMLLALLAFALGHLLLAGYALWRAGDAARSGARAAYVGGDPVRTAERAGPSPLPTRATMRNGRVNVAVRLPPPLPGLAPTRITADSELAPDGEP